MHSMSVGPVAPPIRTTMAMPMPPLNVRSDHKAGGMSDPRHLDYSDWFQVVTGGLLSGIGGAMAWFRGEKRKLNDRVQKVEELCTGQQTQLTVLRICQENTQERLEEIGQNSRDTNEKLSDVQTTLQRWQWKFIRMGGAKC